MSVIVTMMGVIAGPTGVLAQPSTPAASPRRADASVEGTVKKVDRAKGTVEIATGAFGLWAKTLEVRGDTQILAEGRPLSLEDLHEGERVKAGYETRVGENFATSIEVVAGPEPREMPGPAEPKTHERMIRPEPRSRS
jgi:hypothetical protein